MEIFGLHQPHNPESLSLELKIVTTTLMSINEYATTTNLDTCMQFLLKSSGSPLCPNGILTIYICTATRIEATSVKMEETVDLIRPMHTMAQLWAPTTWHRRNFSILEKWTETQQTQREILSAFWINKETYATFMSVTTATYVIFTKDNVMFSFSQSP